MLDVIKYLNMDPPSLDKLLALGAVDSILDLLSHNRSDDNLLFGALEAPSGLMSGQKGIEMVTKAGGRDLIFGIFKDDAKNLTPKTNEAAMVAPKKLARLDMNSQKLLRMV